MTDSGTRRRIARRTLLAGAGSLIASPAILRAQGQGNGVALVIGNSKYRWEASLPNVKRDAPAIAKRFQELGLKTELFQDAGRDAMRQAVDKFAASARGARLAAFYFAGHGASWEKDTYLVPEDADLANPRAVQTLLPVTAVRDAMRDAGHRLLVLDNCRNNPADGWRQKAAAESARMAAAELAAVALHGPNTLVIFSTAPGRTALDGPAGENSPFAAAFLRQLDGTSIDLPALPAKLRRDLLIATDGQQVIWDESTYTGSFVLNAPRTASARGAASSVDPSRIVELPKAYAFSREKKLALPPGLVAIRPQPGSPHLQKIGSFQYLARLATTLQGNGMSIDPFVMVVLSVPEPERAHVVYSGRDFVRAQGTVWRYAVARLSGEEMEWMLATHDGSGSPLYSFKWKDVNSGNYLSTPRTSNFFTPYSSRFTRLDG